MEINFLPCVAPFGQGKETLIHNHVCCALHYYYIAFHECSGSMNITRWWPKFQSTMIFLKVLLISFHFHWPFFFLNRESFLGFSHNAFYLTAFKHERLQLNSHREFTCKQIHWHFIYFNILISCLTWYTSTKLYRGKKLACSSGFLKSLQKDAV